jgi:hypothetical protein
MKSFRLAEGNIVKFSPPFGAATLSVDFDGVNFSLDLQGLKMSFLNL